MYISICIYIDLQTLRCRCTTKTVAVNAAATAHCLHSIHFSRNDVLERGPGGVSLSMSRRERQQTEHSVNFTLLHNSPLTFCCVLFSVWFCLTLQRQQQQQQQLTERKNDSERLIAYEQCRQKQPVLCVLTHTHIPVCSFTFACAPMYPYERMNVVIYICMYVCELLSSFVAVVGVLASFLTVKSWFGLLTCAILLLSLSCLAYPIFFYSLSSAAPHSHNNLYFKHVYQFWFGILDMSNVLRVRVYVYVYVCIYMHSALPLFLELDLPKNII